MRLEATLLAGRIDTGEHLARAHALRAGQPTGKFKACNIDAPKREGRA